MTRLRTKTRCLALLLASSAVPAMAGGLAPLRVSPDLLAPSSQPEAVVPQRLPAPATSPAEIPVETRSVPELEERPAVSQGTPAPEAAPALPAVPVASPAPAASPQAVEPTVKTESSAPVQASIGTAPVTVEQGSTDVRAQRIFGTRMFEMIADGDAELRRDDLLLRADRLTYRELADEILADGNVSIERGGDRISGPRGRLVLHELTGEIESPVYSVTRPGGAGSDGQDIVGQGDAAVLYFEGENQYRLSDATWSTCPAPDPDWYLKASELSLDYDREVGQARGSSLVFKDVPILWWPWAEFPLVARRQSGLLTPTIGMSNKTGLDVSLPYYFNLAPNYDATLAPRLMSRRGLQLAGEFRYLGERYRGELQGEWLPNDRVSGESRSLGAWRHQQRITPDLFASLDLNAVSDDRYFEDLSSRVEGASRTNLLREIRLAYTGGDWWGASALVQSYQTLSGEAPYRRLPQLRAEGRRGGLTGGLEFAFQSEYTVFDHPDKAFATGSRFILHPQLSLPIETAGYYVTPRVALHHTQYSLDRTEPGGRDSITRSLPVLSVDAGMFFDRDTNLFGNAYRQTLEPRLLYVNVPYRRQDDVPLFDTAAFDFGFAQIFSENRYAGSDRIADANQITAAVTSRLIEPESGLERFRATVGQRYYFRDRRVLLPDEREGVSNKTDLLVAASGRVSRTVSIDTAWQYNPSDSSTQRLNTAVRYQPEFGKVLNVGYRYARDVLRDLDVSAQWPIGGGWYGVARMTRSIEEGRITEAIAGLEYNGGCWAFRTALHRFATNPDDTTNALFFQLELSGLGSLGPSPVNLLRRSVPGYGKITDSSSDRFFGAEGGYPK